MFILKYSRYIFVLNILSNFIKYNVNYKIKCSASIETTDRKLCRTIDDNYTVVDQIYTTLETNIENILSETALEVPKDFGDFLNSNENRQKIFNGLEQYQEGNLFAPLFGFSCLLLDIKLKRYEDLSFIDAQINDYYKNENGRSNFTLLAEKINCLNFSEDCEAYKLFEVLFDRKMTTIHSLFCSGHIEYLDFYFRFLSFMIYDQIYSFVINDEITSSLEESLKYLQQYITDKLENNTNEYTDEKILFFQKFLNKIELYFLGKIGIKNKSKQIHLLVMNSNGFCFSNWKKRLQGLLGKYQDNAILQGIVNAYPIENDKDFKKSIFEIQTDYEKTKQFLTILNENKQTKRLRLKLVFKHKKEHMIRRFYHLLKIDRFPLGEGDGELGVSLICFIIFEYYKGNESFLESAFNYTIKKKSKDMNVINSENSYKYTGFYFYKDFNINSALFELSKNYYVSIAKELDFDSIDKQLSKCDFKSDLTFESFIEILLPLFYSDQEKIQIFKHIVKIIEEKILNW